MNQHSYETYEILRHINGLGEVAKWAAFHHEGINGTGYPFHPNERDISIEARMIAVADIFQALAQDRPYRTGMTIKQIISILEEMADNGKLDREIVNMAVQKAEACYQVARGENDWQQENTLYGFLVH